MAKKPEDFSKEFTSAFEESAIAFGDTLQSIASDFTKKLREESAGLDDLSKSLLRNFKNDLAAAGRSASGILDIQDKLKSGALKQQDISKAQFQLDQKINKLFIDRELLRKAGVTLSAKEEENLINAVSALEQQKAGFGGLLDISEQVNKELGILGGVLGGIGSALKKSGISTPFESIVENSRSARAQILLNKKEINGLVKDSIGPLTKVDAERVSTLEKQNQKLTKQTGLGYQIGQSFKETFSIVNIAQVAILTLINGIVQGFSRLNKLQTEFRRLTGESASVVDSLNTELITTADYFQTITGLTQQFGFNAAAAFDAINIQEAAELTNLLGLSADESGKLALYAQVRGENLKTVTESLYTQIGAINDANKSAVSQRQILQDIANASPAIAISLEASSKSLVEAAQNARILGLNLQQVDNIAASLLNIEQSIAAEFEAEVITGKQLNLERARFFALTNDLNGLTKEIAANQEILNSFATGTRIEQEAIAGALGISRDEIAQMIFNQKLQEGISREEAARQAGIGIERAKQLTIQESLNKSIQKMGEAIAGPLELFSNLLLTASRFFEVILATAAALGTMRAVTALINIQKEKGIALSIRQALIDARSAAIKALGSGLPAALAGVAAGALVYAAAKGYLTSGDDVISKPTGKGGYGDRVLFGPEGAISLNNKDSVVAGTNLGGGNQTPQPQIDYDRLANAIASGAERGTSRAKVNTFLDRNRVSSNLQVSNVIEQRQYSI